MGNQMEKMRLNHSSWRLWLAETYSRYERTTSTTSAGSSGSSTEVIYATSSSSRPSRVLMKISRGKMANSR